MNIRPALTAMMLLISFSGYTQQLTIGQQHLGGTIFHLDASGRHGLIVSNETELFSERQVWDTANAWSKMYPVDIEDSPTKPVKKKKTKTNWRLPTLIELQLLYKNREVDGNLYNGIIMEVINDEGNVTHRVQEAERYYWSATPAPNSQMKALDLISGKEISYPLYERCYFIPVRIF